MNNLTKYSLVALLSFGISSSCLATVINDGGAYNDTDVGSTDNLLGEASNAGSDAAELAWVNSILGLDATAEFIIKTASVEYYATNVTNVFAFDVTHGSDYFLVKNATRIALFENLDDMDWGVFNTGELSAAINLPTDPLVISHVSQFNKDDGGNLPGSRPPPVPEPGIMALFGVGLLGMGLMRRRRKAANRF